MYGSLSLVTDEWKIEYYPNEDRLRLFDRKNDSGENSDLGNDSTYTQTKNRIFRILLRWRSGLMDTASLKQRIHAGGPVAKRIAKDLHAAAGNKSEIYINNMIQQYQEEKND
jgi:hypothetical protein